MRMLVMKSQFLSEIPCNEQGYPAETVRREVDCVAHAQLGGTGWTWEAKQREIGMVTDALCQIVRCPYICER